jgi:hypothetical protein
MNIPDKDIRVAIVSLLSGLSRPVRDTFSQPDDEYPRVIIAGVSSRQDGSKSQFMFDTQLNIRITDRYLKAVNTDGVESLAISIMQQLCPSPRGPYPVVDGFEIWNADLSGSQVNNYQRKEYFYIEKNLSITLKIEQS